VNCGRREFPPTAVASRIAPFREFDPVSTGEQSREFPRPPALFAVQRFEMCDRDHGPEVLEGRHRRVLAVRVAAPDTGCGRARSRTEQFGLL
jgi:hypothetical protein